MIQPSPACRLAQDEIGDCGPPRELAEQPACRTRRRRTAARHAHRGAHRRCTRAGDADRQVPATAARAATKARTQVSTSLGRVRRRQLHADARLALRHHRVAERDDVDAVARASRRRSAPASAASPNITGAIGCSPGSRSKPASVIASRNSSVFARSCARASSPVGDQVERGQRAGDHRRRDGVGEQVRPRALPQQLDDLRPAPRCSRRTRRPAPCRACRSTTSTRSCTPASSGVPRAGRADEADRVRVVDHHHRVVAARPGRRSRPAARGSRPSRTRRR